MTHPWKGSEKLPALGIIPLSLTPSPPQRLDSGSWSTLSRQNTEGPQEGQLSPHGTANSPFRNWSQDLSFGFFPLSLCGWDTEIRQGETSGALRVSASPFHSCVGCFIKLIPPSFRAWFGFHVVRSKNFRVVGSDTEKRLSWKYFSSLIYLDWAYIFRFKLYKYFNRFSSDWVFAQTLTIW